MDATGNGGSPVYVESSIIQEDISQLPEFIRMGQIDRPVMDMIGGPHGDQMYVAMQDDYLPMQGEGQSDYLPMQDDYLPMQGEGQSDYLPMQPEEQSDYLSMQPEEQSDYLPMQPEEQSDYLSMQPEDDDYQAMQPS